jgi:ribosomal protein S18 acetylase RimI-like enzyme
MTEKVVTHLCFRKVSTLEHLALNLHNFNFFRRGDSGEAIMFFGTSKFFIWLIAIPYVISSELVFLRTTRFYVSIEDQVAGVLILRGERDILYVSDLSVAPEYRGHGIATAMLNFCTKLARTTSKSWLELSVLKINIPARCLYEKAGFVQKENRRWSFILHKEVS